MASEREGRRPRIGAGRPKTDYRDDNNGANGEGERKPAYSSRESFQREPRPSYDNRNEQGRNPFGNRGRSESFERERPASPFRENRPRAPYGERPSYGNREGNNYGQRQPYGDRPNFNRPSYGGREGNNDRPSYGNNREGYDRPYNREGGYGQQRPYGDRPSYGRPQGDRSYNRNYDNNNQRPSYGNRMQGDNRRPFRPRTDDYNPNAKYGYQKQLKYKEEVADPNEPIRLNKYLANSGVCSRREADEYIQAGVVSVNGEVVTELGRKVLRSDKVTFHNEPVTLESKVYVLLNKPKNCVTTSDDPQGRLTVMDLVRNACSERIYPIGRLDRNTTGVLLLTNDGEMASKLSHPKYNKKKIYQVWLDKNVTMEDMQKIADGIELEDGEIHADAISYVTEEDKSQVGIEIHSGKNRVVRRIFESLGYRVVKLDRVYFAGLTKKNLPRGRWRYLDEKEVTMLRMGSYE